MRHVKYFTTIYLPVGTIVDFPILESLSDESSSDLLTVAVIFTAANGEVGLLFRIGLGFGVLVGGGDAIFGFVGGSGGLAE
jgi:hypothetical protein